MVLLERVFVNSLRYRSLLGKNVPFLPTLGVPYDLKSSSQKEERRGFRWRAR